MIKDVLPHLDRKGVVALLEASLEAISERGLVLVETFNGGLPSASYTLASDLTHQVAFTEHSLRQALLLAGASEVRITGAVQVVAGIRGQVYRAVRVVYCSCVRLRYGIERGFGNNPTIFTPRLMAIAQR